MMNIADEPWMFSLSNILLHMVLKITVFFNISNVVIVYMEIFCCQNFVIKIVMLFHNIWGGVNFWGFDFVLCIATCALCASSGVSMATYLFEWQTVMIWGQHVSKDLCCYWITVKYPTGMWSACYGYFKRCITVCHVP